MKKLIFLMLVTLGALLEINAKPIKWHASGTVEIGRPKKKCDGIWVCLKVDDWGVSLLKVSGGSPTQSLHGIGLGEDGKLYLIISEKLLAANQSDKLPLLKGRTQYILEDDEVIPEKVLRSIQFSGSNVIKAGAKSITYEDGFYYIQLN